MDSKDTTKPYGLGRRKTAVAQVILTEKGSERTVNSLPLETYFPTVAMHGAVTRPLEVTSQNDEYGFSIKVHGGGKHSQAQAAMLAVARALLKVDEGFQKQLKHAGLLSRDPRMKERKKPGLKRARRAPQFSKR